MGTPAYMPPEQWQGQDADERSDQFSFCVALYEALYGERPFDAPSAVMLGVEVTHGKVRKPPAGSKVPGWLRAILLRGLAVDKEQRHPSMGALLEALGHDPSRTRRTWIAAGAILAAAAALVQGYHRMAGHRSGLCMGAEQQLAGVWDEPRRQAMQTAFLRTGKVFAQDAFVGAARALDGFSRRWVGMRQEACEATRVRGEQSEELLDLRMECLGQRREEARALVDLFTQADGEIVTKAVKAANGVGELSSCADLAALRAPIRPPASPELHRQVESLRAKLARTDALEDAGKYNQGLALATTLVDEAKRLAYQPVEAEALLRLGFLRFEAGQNQPAEQAIFDAIGHAEAGHHDQIAAKAWLAMVGLAKDQAHYAEAHRWAQLAEAKLERLGSPPLEESSLLLKRGALLLNEGKYDEALALQRRALAIREKTLGAEDPLLAECLHDIGATLSRQVKCEEALGYMRRALAIREKSQGPDHPDVAWTLSGIGEVLGDEGKYEEALGYHRRALAIREKALGAEHPDIAASFSDIGNNLDGQGKYEEALGYHRRALVIDEKALGPEHPDVATSLTNLGENLGIQGHYEEELQCHRRALAIREKVFGPDHADVAWSLNDIGANLFDRGRYEEALTHYRRALAIREKVFGPENANVAQSLNNIGGTLQRQGKYEEALSCHRRALAIAQKAFNPEHPEVATSLAGEGSALLGLAKAGDAIAPLERAVVLKKRAPGNLTDLAEAEFALARALWDSAQDRGRAKTLASQALAALKGAGFSGKTGRATVAAWLARHR
jgi:tetratricopeptide (TPR) repeat protein